MRRHWWALALLAPLGCVAAPAAPAEPAAPVASVDEALRELGRAWLVDNDGVGLSLGVYDGGQRFFYNFGSTQIDGNRLPTKDTVYEIGSVGKTMTGQLLARAVVEGRATLDDEAAKYLEGEYPNLENGGESVRLLHLANMTSQLPDNIPDVSQVRMVPGEDIAFARMRVYDAYTREEFLRQLHFIKPRLPPGNDPSHSNVASQLLGVLLEKMYGMPFEQLLTREIEKPLKMASGTQLARKLLAKGYSSAGVEMPELKAKTQYASGGLRYGADDLLRYATWQLAERDASVKLAHKATWFSLDKKVSIGFYWIMSDSPQGRRLRYSGGTAGFSSFCALYPDAKIAVVALSNKSTDRAQETLRLLSEKIVETLLAQREISSPSSSAGSALPDR